MNKELGFARGVRDGIPIGLGYLSVSFSFGLLAVRAGLPVWTAVLISATNLTSAGQLAMRYALMAISLSQKVDESFTPLERALAAFGITDEIFAVAASQTGTFGAQYLFGLIVMPFLGWTGGTLLGAAAGNILPEAIKAALGIALYGMFIAVVVPPATQDRGALIAALGAAFLSCCLTYIPAFAGVSQGFAVVICACVAASVAAWLHPLPEDEEEQA